MTLKVPERTFPTAAGLLTQRFALSSRFLRFGLISGFGWLLDFGTLYLLVRWAHVPVFAANLFSASLAAVVAFLLSHKLAFAGQAGSLGFRVLFYCAYTFVIILFASAAISFLSTTAQTFSHNNRLQLATGTCAIIAKLIVTPINFLSNFLVARFTSEYATKSSS